MKFVSYNKKKVKKNFKSISSGKKFKLQIKKTTRTIASLFKSNFASFPKKVICLITVPMHLNLLLGFGGRLWLRQRPGRRQFSLGCRFRNLHTFGRTRFCRRSCCCCLSLLALSRFLCLQLNELLHRPSQRAGRRRQMRRPLLQRASRLCPGLGLLFASECEACKHLCVRCIVRRLELLVGRQHDHVLV